MPTKREVRKMLVKDGWYQLPAKATSHEQYKHPSKPGKVTLAGKENAELPKETWKSIRGQAGWL